MAKRTAKPKWGSATTPKRKSRIWWLSLDKRCKPGCPRYDADLVAVGLSASEPKALRPKCGCVLFHSDDMAIFTTCPHDRFANAPKLVPGGPPVKVRLRMEVV